MKTPSELRAEIMRLLPADPDEALTSGQISTRTGAEVTLVHKTMQNLREEKRVHDVVLEGAQAWYVAP
jgi:hypothetical protein